MGNRLPQGPPTTLQSMRRFHFKVMRAYLLLLTKILESIVRVAKEPAFLFDCGIITYWVSKLIVQS